MARTILEINSKRLDFLILRAAYFGQRLPMSQFSELNTVTDRVIALHKLEYLITLGDKTILTDSGKHQLLDINDGKKPDMIDHESWALLSEEECNNPITIGKPTVKEILRSVSFEATS